MFIAYALIIVDLPYSRKKKCFVVHLQSADRIVHSAFTQERGQENNMTDSSVRPNHPVMVDANCRGTA